MELMTCVRTPLSFHFNIKEATTRERKRSRQIETWEVRVCVGRRREEIKWKESNTACVAQSMKVVV